MRLQSFSFLVLFAAACSGGGETTVKTTTPTTPDNPGQDKSDPDWQLPPDAGATAAVTPDAAPAPVTKPVAEKPNMQPEVQRPLLRKIGVGQTVSFGLPAIDHDGDTVAVTMLEKPASATWDPITLTVTWKPKRSERGKAGVFKIRVTETQRVSKKVTTQEITYSIDVVRRRQRLPRAKTLDPVVEQLLTVHDRARLKRVNRKWSFDKMLRKAAELHWAGSGKKVPSAKELYRGFLASQAKLHMNDRLDPASKSFDKRAFGSPRNWEIVTVRPRLDKRWQEIRVVWRATRAAEPMFAMFRFRPTKGSAEALATGRDDNNKFFSQMVSATLMGKKGGLHRKNKRARNHAKAIAKLVDRVVSFKHKNKAYGATFLALATGARMGGGSARDEKGNYLHGDGWAWSAMKPLEKDGKIAFTNVPIKGFWTATQRSKDGKRWIAKCAKRFAGGEPGYEVLCRAGSQLVDLPAKTADGKVTSGFREAANLYVEHKAVHSVAELPLTDGRRDFGEEKGMTCSQCHTRAFGIRDWKNDSAGSSPNGKLATTFFLLVPTDRWSPYMLRFQKAQQCLASAEMERVLGRSSGLGCPLTAP